MKDSRKYVIIGFLLLALFCAGAVLGSCIPKAIVYLIITAVAIAIVSCIVFGYTGYEKKNDNLVVKPDLKAFEEAKK